MVDNKKVKKSAGTAVTHAKNAAEVAKGKVKSSAGKVVGDHRLETEGKLDEAKGRVKQAGQKVSETFKK
ncbi:MAG: CsbD family protein [Acidimicrobiales bacterium]